MINVSSGFILLAIKDLQLHLWNFVIRHYYPIKGKS